MNMLLNKNSTIIDITDEDIVREDLEVKVGTNSTYYDPENELQIIEGIEIPPEVECGKYKYIGGFFELDTDYKEPIDPDKEINNLKTEIQGLQAALAEISIMMATP